MNKENTAPIDNGCIMNKENTAPINNQPADFVYYLWTKRTLLPKTVNLQTLCVLFMNKENIAPINISNSHPADFECIMNQDKKD